MKMPPLQMLSFFVLLPLLSVQRAPAAPASGGSAEYFRAETVALAGRCLAEVHSRADWDCRRGEYRRQLQEMLGLWPMPERTALHPVVTGKLEQEDFTVEKLHFQALPKLYVTANLYLPKTINKPLPGILYVCGHAQVVTNGVSCGNKAGYQHHGAWFARNGYVCLVVDTLQYGEIRGAHRGTYGEGQWWWNARGYTPAGVEAWFGIRALDYLCSRPEVDKERLGLTGRSGGGSYTWTVAALDERVKVAAPVAGITDLQSQVVDGAVEGHCDCMFFVNTYRWDFPLVAALVAPRPLLLGNTDKDRIFPLDGVVRLYEKTRGVYDLYNARTNLGLLITEGPHADTQELQVPVFRWFNRFLKRQEPPIEMAAKKFFAPEQLRVFDKLPQDQINTTVQECFVPQAKPFSWSQDPAQRQHQEQECLEALRKKAFAGWPAEPPPAKLEACAAPSRKRGICVELRSLETQPGVAVPLYLVRDTRARKTERVVLTVLDASGWTNSPARDLWLGNRAQGGLLSPVLASRGAEGVAPGAATAKAVQSTGQGSTSAAEIPEGLREQLENGKVALAFLAPRGVQPAEWPKDAKAAAQVRRRYMLLGQTLDSMRVWDIRCAARALAALPEFKQVSVCVSARGQMGINAAYAALFEPGIQKLELDALPASHQQGPDFLNVLRVWDIPQLLEVLGQRVRPSQGPNWRPCQ